jgi:tetratricopeptide (TPR) repeat protein
MPLRSCWPLLILLAPLWGCGGAREAPSDAAVTVTYCRDVAPILFAKCVNCHRPGEVAPFSLLTYNDARKRAQQIREVTHSRFMPPWLPDAGHEQFQAERRLSDAERDLLSKWVAASTPEGDVHDLPSPPKFASGWQLGEPDLVLECDEFQLPATGMDRFRNFVLSVPIDRTRWIRAVELRPENPRVTHHARLGIDNTFESSRRDAADAQPGYEGMAWGQDPPGQLITWTPGMLPDMGIPGAAWKLTPDTKLVLHTHLQTTGKQETVRFRVGLYYADAPPTVRPLILRTGSRDIDIPADESKQIVKDVYELPIDVDLLSLFPHAHKLCREIVVNAVLPDGAARTLIAIRAFDEKWHDKYRFVEPVRLPQGTRLETQFTYDNSTANVRNPHTPPQRVVYGSNANDEMSDVYLQVTPVDPAQYAVLEEHQKQVELRSEIVGYKKTLEMFPSDRWSLEGLASCYVADHQPAQAIQLLKGQPELLKDSPQSTMILGMAELAAGNAQGAEKLLRQVLKSNNELSLAWLGLGQSLVVQKQVKLAEDALRRAVKLDPRLTVARLDLIDLLVSQERLDEAVTAAKAAVELAPDEHPPQLKLANVYAQQKKYDASLASFAAARKLAPFVYSPQSSLAIACYQFGDEKTANRLLAEAITLDAVDPVPRFFLGQIARRNSAWTEAQKELQLAADLPVPRTWPASHVHQFLKLVYTEQLLLAQQMEDTELARNVVKTWLKLEPENEALRKLQGELNTPSPELQPSAGKGDLTSPGR